MWESVRAFLGSLRWWWTAIVVSLLAGGFGFLQQLVDSGVIPPIIDASSMIPATVWWAASYFGLASGAFAAFHKVRIERDALKPEAERHQQRRDKLRTRHVDKLRLLRLKPSFYSFLAGIVVALAGNVLASFLVDPARATLIMLVVIVLQLAAGGLFFLVSARLDEIRTDWLSLKSKRDVGDLDRLLREEERARPILLSLAIACLALAGSIVCVAVSLIAGQSGG